MILCNSLFVSNTLVVRFLAADGSELFPTSVLWMFQATPSSSVESDSWMTVHPISWFLNITMNKWNKTVISFVKHTYLFDGFEARHTSVSRAHTLPHVGDSLKTEHESHQHITVAGPDSSSDLKFERKSIANSQIQLKTILSYFLFNIYTKLQINSTRALRPIPDRRMVKRSLYGGIELVHSSGNAIMLTASLPSVCLRRFVKNGRQNYSMGMTFSDHNYIIALALALLELLHDDLVWVHAK